MSSAWRILWGFDSHWRLEECRSSLSTHLVTSFWHINAVSWVSLTAWDKNSLSAHLVSSVFVVLWTSMTAWECNSVASTSDDYSLAYCCCFESFFWWIHLNSSEIPPSSVISSRNSRTSFRWSRNFFVLNRVGRRMANNEDNLLVNKPKKLLVHKNWFSSFFLHFFFQFASPPPPSPLPHSPLHNSIMFGADGLSQFFPLCHPLPTVLSSTFIRHQTVFRFHNNFSSSFFEKSASNDYRSL